MLKFRAALAAVCVVLMLSPVLMSIGGTARAQEAPPPAFQNFTPATMPDELRPSAEVPPPAANDPAPVVEPVASDAKGDTLIGLGPTIMEIVGIVGLVLGGLVKWVHAFLKARGLTALANRLHGTETEDGILDRAILMGMEWCNARAKDLGNVDVRSRVLANAIGYMQEFAAKDLAKFKVKTSEQILKLLLPHLPDVPPEVEMEPIPRIFGEAKKPTAPEGASAATPAPAPVAPSNPVDDLIAALTSKLPTIVDEAIARRFPKAA